MTARALYARSTGGAVNITSTGSLNAGTYGISAIASGGIATVTHSGIILAGQIGIRTTGTAGVTVNQTGDISAGLFGIYGVSSGGAVNVTSNGNFNATGQFGIFARGSGTTTVTHTGALAGLSGAYAQSTANTANVTFSGTINVAVDGLRAKGATGATINSTGDITANTAGGIYASTQNGLASINSTGNIIAGIHGIEARSTNGSVTVTQSGSILAGGRGIFVNAVTGATVNHTGDITSTTQNAVYALATTGTVNIASSGVFNAPASAAIFGRASGLVTLSHTGNLNGIGGVYARSLVDAVNVNVNGAVDTTSADSIFALASTGTTVNHTGPITATGALANGIYARSSTGTVSVTGNGSINAYLNAIFAINGSAVVVNHTGDLTSSIRSAVYANSTLGTVNVTTNGALSASQPAIAAFGAGAVAVNHTGTLAGSAGVYARSSTAAVSTTVNGSINAVADGIVVNANTGATVNQTGNITANTSRSIYARSTTGDINITSAGNFNAQLDVMRIRALGGSLTVNHTGDLTSGSQFGIYATATAAGGTANIVTRGTLNAVQVGILAVASGAVTVNHTGNLTSSSLAGIYGRSFTGAVNVSVNGNVAAPADAILTNSALATTVNVIGGRVTGGALGAGVAIQNGTNNTLHNFGIIGSLSALAISGGAGNETINNSGTVIGLTALGAGSNVINNFGTMIASSPVIQTEAGDDTVSNAGVLTGDVDLGAGSNTFNNLAGGLFNSVASINLGAGNLLTNAGTLAPGGLGVLQTTQLTGNFLQTTGAFAVDVNRNGTADRLNISGTAHLAGTVRPTLVGVGGTANQFTILSATLGLTNNGITAVDTPVIDYGLQFPNANDMVLTVNINFVPTGLTLNEIAVGNTLNRVAGTGAPTGLDGLLTSLANISSLAAYQAALNRLSGEGSSGTQNAAFQAASQFQTTLTDQIGMWLSGGSSGTTAPEAPLSYGAADRVPMAFKSLKASRSNPGTWHAWAAGFRATQTIKGDATIGSAEQSSGAWGGSFGLNYLAHPRILVGIGVGASQSNFSVPDRATTGELQAGHVGGYAVHGWGAGYVSALVSYSHFSNSTKRTIAVVGPVERANGSFESQLLGMRAEAGHRWAHGQWGVTPFAAIQFSTLWQDGYREVSQTAAGTPGALGLAYAPTITTSLPFFLGVKVDTLVVLDNGWVGTPYAKAAWVHEFTPNRQIQAAFLSTLQFGFSVDGARPSRDALRLEAGVQTVFTQRTSIVANFASEIAGRSWNVGGSAALRVNW